MTRAASDGVSPTTFTLPPSINGSVPVSVTRALCSSSAASRTFTCKRSPGPMVRLSVCAWQQAAQQNRNNNLLTDLIISSSLLVLIFLAAVVAVVAVVCRGTAGNKIQQNADRRPALIFPVHEQELIRARQGGSRCEADTSQQNSGVCHLLQQLRICNRKNRWRVQHDEIEFPSPLLHQPVHAL